MVWPDRWESGLLVPLARELATRPVAGFPLVCQRRGRLFFVRPGQRPAIACVTVTHDGRPVRERVA
ncbi:MAG: hypothetical protein JXP34_19930 [Planctomycetes bacterium]|nr:hypothetical protein [Planctomycetota bacterium]